MIDPHSATWLAVRERADKGVSTALDALSTEGTSERDADTLRGRIAAYRDILKLAEPPREITSTNPLY